MSNAHGRGRPWCHRVLRRSALPVYTAGKKVAVSNDCNLEPGFKGFGGAHKDAILPGILQRLEEVVQNKRLQRCNCELHLSHTNLFRTKSEQWVELDQISRLYPRKTSAKDGLFGTTWNFIFENPVQLNRGEDVKVHAHAHANTKTNTGEAFSSSSLPFWVTEGRKKIFVSSSRANLLCAQLWQTLTGELATRTSNKHACVCVCMCVCPSKWLSIPVSRRSFSCKSIAEPYNALGNIYILKKYFKWNPKSIFFP